MGDHSPETGIETKELVAAATDEMVEAGYWAYMYWEQETDTSPYEGVRLIYNVMASVAAGHAAPRPFENQKNPDAAREFFRRFF